ncbi:fimbrial protein [Serratia silvae]|uniref:Fimbrial protein n=1 Tax=Serratia silvae TaxID=2824122 RepID=A0ABT0KCS1_9GAMM|nr:fimbrial protein [Serratia silvae]MCL1029819.1 fimbrial protein [Serratia silvae]
MLCKSLLAIPLFLVLCVSQVQADGGTAMNFKGRIFEPACKFNGGKAIDVNFGKVGIKKVDGVKYSQFTVVDLNCKESPGKKLRLQLQGEAIGGVGNILTTNIANLGIALQDANGRPIALNHFFDAVDQKTFIFIAVPVKRDTTIPLGTGQFNAVATLVSSYF